MDGYMTLTELADKIGVKAGTLRRQVLLGVLKASKVGTGAHAVWLVSDEEAERYARDHAGKPGRKPQRE
jgi:hypothetical protein